MSTCHSLAEVLAAADADSLADPPLSQETADQVAALLYPARKAAAAA